MSRMTDGSRIKEQQKFFFGLAENVLPKSIEDVLVALFMRKQAVAENDLQEATRYEDVANKCLEEFISTVPSKVLRKKRRPGTVGAQKKVSLEDAKPGAFSRNIEEGVSRWK